MVPAPGASTMLEDAMPRRKSASAPPDPATAALLQPLNPHAAGIDIGATELAKAITATAYKLARIIYALLKYGTAYVAQGLEAYETAYRERVVRQLKRKATELGLVLVERDA